MRCKCGKEFFFPAWNLNPISIPSLNGFEVFNRNQDLIGLEVLPKVASPVTEATANKPIPAFSAETNSPRKHFTTDSVRTDRISPKPPNTDIAKAYLAKALDAERYDQKDRLRHHEPPLGIAVILVSRILLDYTILSVTTETPPRFDPKIPLGQQTRPVSQMFEAVVSVTLCDRPNYPGTFAELLASRPKTYSENWKFNCKEFTDGYWFFLCLSGF